MKRLLSTYLVLAACQNAQPSANATHPIVDETDQPIENSPTSALNTALNETDLTISAMEEPGELAIWVTPSLVPDMWPDPDVWFSYRSSVKVSPRPIHLKKLAVEFPSLKGHHDHVVGGKISADVARIGADGYLGADHELLNPLRAMRPAQREVPMIITLWFEPAERPWAVEKINVETSALVTFPCEGACDLTVQNKHTGGEIMCPPCARK